MICVIINLHCMIRIWGYAPVILDTFYNTLLFFFCHSMRQDGSKRFMACSFLCFSPKLKKG